MKPTRNPVVFTAQGDESTGRAQILAIVWEGATTAGDQAELTSRSAKADLLWAGRATGGQTYQGINFAPYGLPARGGFRCATLAAGRLLIYLQEE